MEAPSLSHASVIPIDMLAGEVYERHPANRRAEPILRSNSFQRIRISSPRAFLDAIES